MGLARVMLLCRLGEFRIPLASCFKLGPEAGLACLLGSGEALFRGACYATLCYAMLCYSKTGVW